MTATLTSRNTLGDAVRYLAGRCDWAVTRDGVGYNGSDTGFGHWLATQAEATWTPPMKVAAHDMLRKYREQLATAGIEFDEIPVPYEGKTGIGRHSARQAAQDERRARERARHAAERREAEKALRIVDRVADGGIDTIFTVSFPYDADLVDAVKAIPGRRWNGKVNTVPLDSAAALKAFAAEHDFTVTEAAARRLDSVEAVEAPPSHLIDFADGIFTIRFPKDFALIEKVRQIEGRRFDGKKVYWWVPTESDSVRDLVAFIRENREVFTVTDAAAGQLDRLTTGLAASDKAKARLRDLSEALKGERAFEAPGDLHTRSYQDAGIEYALRAKRTFLADDTGTGKTVMALLALREEDAFPAVVVVRSSLKGKWRDEVATWLPGRRAVVLNGTKAAAADFAHADVIVVNYDILAQWAGTAAKDGVTAGKRAKDVDRPGPLALAPIRGLVIDESHYGKTPDAKRTRAMLMLSKSVRGRDGLIMNLTATPTPNRPIELAAQLAILDRLKDFGGYWKFARKYCGAYRDTYGWDVSGSSNEAELHERLRSTCYVRRPKKLILPELPDIQPARLPVDIDNRVEYERAERDVARWVVEQVEKDEEFMASIMDLTADEQAAAIKTRKRDKAIKARSAEELVKLSALRRLAARGKLNDALNWIDGFLEENPGQKLVVWATHRDIQAGLFDHFDERDDFITARIHADDDHELRHAQATRFQEDPKTRLIICSLDVAREGIDLFAASNTLFVEFGWNWETHNQAEGRLIRIGQEADKATAWYLTAEDTIDEDLQQMIESKRRVAELIKDGKVADREVIRLSKELAGSFTKDLLDKVKARAAA